MHGKTASGSVLEHFHVYVTVSISRSSPKASDISLLYGEAQHATLYRYIFGRMAVLFPDMIQSNLDNAQFDDGFALERKLIEEIRGGSLPQAEEALLAVLSGMSHLRHDNMMLSVMHLLHAFRQVTDEFNQSREKPVILDFQHASARMLEHVTIDELYEDLHHMLVSLLSGRKADTNERHMALIEAVRELVKAGHPDPGLCLAGIGNALRMSPNYVGRIFRENTGTSVAEFINEVRMLKTAELLKGTTLGIGAIMERVGIENESNFYKQFKKRFGLTPKEYARQAAMGTTMTS